MPIIYVRVLKHRVEGFVVGKVDVGFHGIFVCCVYSFAEALEVLREVVLGVLGVEGKGGSDVTNIRHL